MLTLGNLMVRSLNCVAHFFKSKANIATAVFAVVDWVKVEIACLVACCKGRGAVLIKFKEEEFAFGTYIEAITHFCCLVDNLLKNISRVALKRCNII